MEQLNLLSKKELEKLVKIPVGKPKKDLTKRAELTDNEKIKYDYPIDLPTLRSFVDNGTSSGVPAMLMTTISEFTKKPKEKLDYTDMLLMYKSIIKCFPDEEIDYNNHNLLKKWRKANKLTRFELKQYNFMEDFLENHLNTLL